MKKIALILYLCFSNTAFAASDGVIYDFQGPVLINGKLASKATPIHFGDEVLTGSRGRIGIQLDGNVYSIGSQSRLSLPKTTTNFTLNFFFGSILAVFRHDTRKTIQTKTAVLGVRGTGLYLSTNSQETYLCTCYGDIDFQDNANQNSTSHIHADYHNAIVFTHETHAFHTMQPMLNHQTEDLFRLEALVSRTPPETFVPKNTEKNTYQAK